MTEKQSIVNHLLKKLEEKANVLKSAIQATKESRNSDTKSSAGDKFETGREMMQIELDKNETQLSKTMLLIKELNRIDFDKHYQKIEFGSLVFTNHGNYFISVGIGKVSLENNHYFAISLNSPIGKLLNNKNVGDNFNFQGKTILIDKIQ